MLSKVLRLIRDRWPRYLEEVREFLRMPSISATGEGIEETASYLEEWLRERLGAKATLLRYGGHPIVYGHLNENSPYTLILYSMYDVQPVDPIDQWTSHPFNAEIVEGRIVARGAVNTKAPLMSMLLGVEALRDSVGIPVNLVFVLEGEEELGSPSMPKLIEDRRRELSAADGAAFIIATEHERGKPLVELGCKGIIFLELECRTSTYDVHSSLVQAHYNPVEILANVISSLKGVDGGVKVEWLYEDVVTPTREDLEYLEDLMEAFPLDKLRELYGVRELRGRGRDLYIEVFFKPSINVDGIVGGHYGPGTKTITPSHARAKLDIRLVPNMDPSRTLERFMEHLSKLGLRETVKVKVHDMYDWSRTSPRSPIALAAVRAYEDLGMHSYVIPTVTGSAPFYLFTKALGVPIVAAGPGYGGRAHAPNEFIEVDGVRRLIEYTAALLLELPPLLESRGSRGLS